MAGYNTNPSPVKFTRNHMEPVNPDIQFSNDAKLSNYNKAHNSNGNAKFGIQTNGDSKTANGLSGLSIGKNQVHIEGRPSDEAQEDDKTWVSEWKVFADGVAISGMKFIVDSSIPVFRRIIWLLLVLCGGGLMTYQLVERVAHYYSYPKGTVFEVSYPDKMIFPAVTLCNENRVKYSHAAYFGLEKMFETMYWPFTDPGNPHPGVDFKGLDALYRSQPKNATDWRMMNRVLSPSYEESVVRCVFNNQPCWQANMTRKFTDMGYCITFNPDANWKVSQSGMVYGLKLILGVNQAEYLAYRESLAGFRILFNEPGDSPGMDNRGILLAPGTSVNVEVRKVKNTLLPPPYGECDPNMKLTYLPAYTVDNCYTECLHKHLYEKCKCVHFSFCDYMPNATVCDPREEAVCVFSTMVDYYDNNLADTLCTCPPACNTTTYSHSLSVGAMATHFVDFMVDEVFNKSIDANSFRSDYLSVNVFYPSLSITKITEEKAYDIFTLFCDMGGALGLLLGSTFLTIYEFVDFFVFTAWQVYTKK